MLPSLRISLVLISISFFCIFPSLAANASSEITINPPVPQIQIPGLIFSSADDGTLVKEGSDGEKILIIPFLGEYLAAVFRYAVGIIGVLAVIVIIFSGIQMMLPGNIATAGSGDQKQSINKAKQRIQTALVGMILAYFSYTILFIINPDLIRFRNLEIQYVPPVNYGAGNNLVDEEANEPLEVATSPIQADPSNLGYGFNGVPYFAQGGSPWGSLQYQPTNCRRDTSRVYRTSACGPTSFAMVLKYYNKNADPKIIGDIAINTGARTCTSFGTGKTDEYFNEIKRRFNVEIEIIQPNAAGIAQVMTLLTEKKPIIHSGPQVGYTSTGSERSYTGHYIVYTGIDVDPISGQQIIRINDSGQSNPSRGISYKTMEQFAIQSSRYPFIYIHPKDA